MQSRLREAKTELPWPIAAQQNLWIPTTLIVAKSTDNIPQQTFHEYVAIQCINAAYLNISLPSIRMLNVIYVIMGLQNPTLSTVVIPEDISLLSSMNCSKSQEPIFYILNLHQFDILILLVSFQVSRNFISIKLVDHHRYFTLWKYYTCIIFLNNLYLNMYPSDFFSQSFNNCDVLQFFSSVIYFWAEREIDISVFNDKR